MATLDNTDFTEIRDFIRYSPNKQVFRDWGIEKPVWKLLFQAAEDWFIGAFNTTPTTSFKGALDAVMAAQLPEALPALTNPQAVAIGKTWMKWRFSK